MFAAAARRSEWEPADDPRCQQFRAAGDSSWLLGHCFKIIMMQVSVRSAKKCVRRGLNSERRRACSVQAGFAVVESSFVRRRNSANIMMKNVVDLCMGALGFWAFGWALAYGVDINDPKNVNGFCGTGGVYAWLGV